MDSSREQGPGARDAAASRLRRDVLIYDKGQLVERLVGYPVRLMFDGRPGVAYKGWVYPLGKGNSIDLDKPSHKDASLRGHHGAQDPKNSGSGQRPAVDRWTFESNGEVRYIKFDAADDVKDKLIDELNACGLGARRCVSSAGRAKNRQVYAWSIQLALRGCQQECQQRVREILAPTPMESRSVLGGRRRSQTGAAAAGATGPSARRAEALSVGDEPTASDTIEVGNKLPFEVLPPGSGIHELAATIRASGNHTDEELDLRRLGVLIDIESHFPQRHPRRYDSGFPSDEKGNRYVVLVITAPGGGEDAIAISPLSGQHATFLVRHGIAQQPWRAVLSKTKAEAARLGAERLIFRARPDEGMDEYEAMLAKIIELLDGAAESTGGELPLSGSRPYLPHRLQAEDDTVLQSSPSCDASENFSVATLSDRTALGASMVSANAFQRLSGLSQLGLVAGTVALFAALTGGSWLLGIVGAGFLIGVGWKLYVAGQVEVYDEPWPWPADVRSLAEGMARPIDPTPKRLLPPVEKAAMVAHVATTEEELKRLIADKPPFWPLVVFASVVLQRRNAVQGRLRTCASGYQPRTVIPPLSGRAYSRTAYAVMKECGDIVGQLEQFMLSPAFKGAFGESGREDSADPDAIVNVADRLMDYHETLLGLAEACLQTPVEAEAFTFVQDMGAFALCPLVGYEQFIETLCARIGEAQDLLPYTDPDTAIALDAVNLGMDLPDDLLDRIVARINRFTR